MKQYLNLVYRAGMIERTGKGSIDKVTGENLINEEFASLGVESLRGRVRYFSEGVILGSKEFCTQQFNTFRSSFMTKKERTGQPIQPRREAVPGGLLDICAMRRLN
ncbi:hypothetical protein JXQ70_11185 [bacterium]|nr:hypothetical protein [bacterium]